MRNLRLFPVVLAVCAIACSGSGDGGGGGGGGGDDDDNQQTGPVVPASGFAETLSSYKFFTGNGSTQEPVDSVMPYAPLSPLFSDYAAKHRFIYVPSAGGVTYSDREAYEFVTGSVLIKTFSYSVDERDASLGEKLIETRLLIRRDSGWDVMTYRWNDEQTEATRSPYGSTVPMSWIDSTGTTRDVNYIVPNTNDCGSCHRLGSGIVPLGVKTRQLNGANHDTANMVDAIEARGWFSGPVPSAAERETLPNPLTTEVPVEQRARAYVDANCAHCHRQNAKAGVSGMWLEWHETDPTRLGVCKVPPGASKGSCGLSYDVVPGKPDESILICRINSTEPEIKMPELPTTLVHREGAALLRQWIAEMPPAACSN